MSVLLPAELYLAILAHIPTSVLQQTVLALSRALPYAPIPLHGLFNSVSIKYPDQAPRLYQRLRSTTSKQDGDAANSFDPSLSVHHFSVETWQVDADVLVNLIRLLPNLVSLNIWIGPSNFAPEHLEDILKPHMPKLRYLGLRFRPYVKKATYYQFLKGSYFDSSLLAVSAWPPSPAGLPTISIVQDPFIPDPDDSHQRFAQPIVFFRLDLHVSLLVHSELSFTSLSSLRVRIPGRPIVRPLTIAYLNPSTQTNRSTPSPRPAPPSIHFLDVATCNVSEDDIETLLIGFKDLKHLVLDSCTGLLRSGSPQLIGQDMDWWFALGKKCALAGVKKARDREKALKSFYEDLVQKNTELDNAEPLSTSENRRPRRGRRGLATATISIRGSTSPPRAVPISSTPAPNVSRNHPLVVPKIHIVPPLPTLSTISLFPTSTQNIPAAILPDDHASAVTEFGKGWNDGIRILWERRKRMGTTFRRDYDTESSTAQYFKFREGNEAEWAEQVDGLNDLENIELKDEGMFFRSENGTSNVEPILCLAGLDDEADGHSAGCGHSVGRDIWMKRL